MNYPGILMIKFNKVDIIAILSITLSLLPTTIYIGGTLTSGYYRIISAIVPLFIFVLFLIATGQIRGNFFSLNAPTFKYWYLIIIWVVISSFLNGNITNGQFVNKMLPTLISFIIALQVGWIYINLQNRPNKYFNILFFAILIHCIVFMLHTLLHVGVYWIFPYGSEFIFTIFQPFRADLNPGAGYTTIGLFSGIMVILSTYYFRNAKSKLHRLSFLIIVIFGIFLNFSSGNRASMLGMLSMPLVYVILAIVKIKKNILRISIKIILYLLVGFFLLPNPLMKLLFENTASEVFLGKTAVNESISSRIEIYHQIWDQKGIDTLIFGYKWESFFGGYGQLNHPHNLLIEFLVVGGLLGFVLAISNLVNVIAPLLYGFWIKRNDNNIITPLLLGFILFFFLFLTNNWNFQSAPLFGYWMAFCIYYAKTMKKNTTINDGPEKTGVDLNYSVSPN